MLTKTIFSKTGMKIMADIMLHRELYREDIIERAIEAYGSLAYIESSLKGDYLICNFFNCVYAKDTTIKEFLNYLIDLSNQMTIG